MRLSVSFFLAAVCAQAALAQAPDGSPERRLADDPRILLDYAQFDPVAGAPVVPPQLQANATSHLHIVQFWSTPTDADRAAVRAAGGEIRGYLPHDCHLVLAPFGADALFRLPQVRWVGPYHPAYRLEQFLIAEVLRGDQVPVRRYNMVMTDKRRDKAALAAKVAAVGGEVVDAQEGGLLFVAGLSGAQLLAAAQWDEVAWIDRWSAPELDMDNARIQSGATIPESSGGYTGSGVRGHIYEGVEANHPDFSTALTQIGPVSCTGADAHGHCTAGIVFGNGTSAPQARGFAPDAVGFFTNYLGTGNATCATSPARNTIIGTAVNTHQCMFTTSSWGDSTTTIYSSISADADDIVFDHRLPWTQSQSNTGNQNSRPQAWAKNVISVGAFHHNDNATSTDDSWLNGNGSTGPAADGRNKPDVSAYYDSIWTSDLSGAAGYSTGNSFTGFNGTSGATPMVAGMNAIAIQMFTDGIFSNPLRVPGGTRFQNRPYAQTVKALQIACAAMLTPTATDNRREHVGWGMPNLGNMYTRRHKLAIVPEDEPIQQGQTHTYEIEVLPGESVLKVCMTYLDPAGNPAAALDRVNDLNLRVVSPGTIVATYWGNNGLAGSAQTNQSSAGGISNSIDTVEVVVRNNPTPGIWTVYVTAPTVVQDANLATAATDATYALVVNGGRRIYGSGCARYIPDVSPTDASGNYYPWGGYTPTDLATTFAGGNGGGVGGTVFANLNVTNPIWVHGFDLNCGVAAGTDVFCDVYLSDIGVPYGGIQTNPAAWTATSAGRGTSAGPGQPTRIELAKPFRLAAGVRALAIVGGNFGHDYTNGSNSYSNSDVQIVLGAATSGTFSGTVFSPRTANLTLRHRTDTDTAQNMRYQTILRRSQLGSAGTITDLSFSGQSAGYHYNSNLLVRMSHVPQGHVLSTTFATNLPNPVTVLSSNEYTFRYDSGVWRNLGLQTGFAYDGNSDVVVDITARGNVQTTTGTGDGPFHRSDVQERVYASFSSLTPTTGTHSDNGGLRMRVGFDCAGANEHGSSCGSLVAAHTGDGRRGATFNFRVAGATPNLVAFVNLGLSSGFPLPVSLTSFGWTNCTAFTDSVVMLTVPTTASGTGIYPLAVPNTASLDGAIVFGQWIGLDSSEPGSLTFSNVTRMLVGVAP
ncbi:MAG: S8 family serine peptidase [Planctomycetes bacterium]|nr:S8 family serine peptidase [Planctomycetota bacterium]